MCFPRLSRDETSHVTELALEHFSSLNGEVSFFCPSPGTSFGDRYGWHQALHFWLSIKMSAFLLVASSPWLNCCLGLRGSLSQLHIFQHILETPGRSSAWSGSLCVPWLQKNWACGGWDHSLAAVSLLVYFFSFHYGINWSHAECLDSSADLCSIAKEARQVAWLFPTPWYKRMMTSLSLNWCLWSFHLANVPCICGLAPSI